MHLSKADTIEDWGMLDIMRSLTDNFVSVNYHMNNWGCFEDDSRRLKSGAF